MNLMQISAEWLGGIIGVVCGLLYFERRMTRVETKIDLLVENLMTCAKARAAEGEL